MTKTPQNEDIFSGTAKEKMKVAKCFKENMKKRDDLMKAKNAG